MFGGGVNEANVLTGFEEKAFQSLTCERLQGTKRNENQRPYKNY